MYSFDCVCGLIGEYMLETLSEWDSFTNSCIYSILLGLFDDDEQAALIPELVETAHSEATQSEHIFSTPSYIDSILVLLLEGHHCVPWMY